MKLKLYNVQLGSVVRAADFKEFLKVVIETLLRPLLFH